jgi:DNA-binding NarL/FixJ family response regulator
VIALTTILIADDHSFYRAQLRTLLESVQNWQVCAEAVNGTEAVEMHSYFEPDITVMDFNMPEVNGLLASREILRKSPAANILMLTVFASSQLAARAKREGIKAFCSKTDMPCIILAIESLLRGETYFPESFAASA